MTGQLAEEDRCTCIVLKPVHDHEPGACQRRGKVKGGQCTDCHYWNYAHREKE